MPGDLPPPLSREEASQPVNRGMLRAELAAQAGTLRGELTAQAGTLRGEMAAMRDELRGEIRASESRTRVLIEDVHGMLKLVLERLADAIAGNAQIARVDADVAAVRARADAAAALGPRVNDHERRIQALEGPS